MTTPSTLKTWIALAGGLLSVVVPLVLQLAPHLPPQWASGVAGLITLLTVFGVYHAPYFKPPDPPVAPQPSPPAAAPPPATPSPPPAPPIAAPSPWPEP